MKTLIINTQLEMQHYYLREMFTNIMGFNAFAIVRAQGTGKRPCQRMRCCKMPMGSWIRYLMASMFLDSNITAYRLSGE